MRVSRETEQRVNGWIEVDDEEEEVVVVVEGWWSERRSRGCEESKFWALKLRRNESIPVFEKEDAFHKRFNARRRVLRWAASPPLFQKGRPLVVKGRWLVSPSPACNVMECIATTELLYLTDGIVARCTTSGNELLLVRKPT